MQPSEPLLSVAQVRAIEAAAQATSPQPPLMERAGRVVAEQALGMLAEAAVAPTHGAGIATETAEQPAASARVLVLAGPGNNGGDALVAARHLRAAGVSVCTMLAGDPARLPPDAGRALEHWLAAGGSLAAEWPLATPDLIIDGLLGIGISRAPADAIASLVRKANASGAPVLAIDVPSGLDADTGVALEPAIRAQRTVTFLGDKLGLHRGDGPACAGVVVTEWLGCRAASAVGPDAKPR
jgi:hydroxyethylthiazole kinase-like uncharacterized protein yjeF